MEDGGKEVKPHPSRIDDGSYFYTRIVPWMLIGMGLIMGVLIVLALGVLLGFVPFR